MNAKCKREYTASLWIEKGKNDLINAEYTLTLKEHCPFDTVCFHAQQCVEKHLKALLVFYAIDFPKTHDIGALIDLIPSEVSLDFNLTEVLMLNRYAIESRYPGDWEPILRTESEKAVIVAQKVRNSINKHLNIKKKSYES